MQKNWQMQETEVEVEKNNAVDIIIPVFNAAEDLVLCLESVFKYTDLMQNRLILIDDASSDPATKKLLDDLGKENVIIVHNKENLGFSAGVNIGMGMSDKNDVLLLNSDTIVTKGWLQKIVNCAYSAPEIATATPLSNNATLCSVPEIFEDNSLPENIDAAKMGELVERCSMRKYPRITVANGFCMFIKRSVIHEIGLFDAETFGRGYGEENDFCCRAEQAGYINVQCDDTYIFHKGTRSFGSYEKQAYIKEHDRILRQRYPDQMYRNDVYVRDNPNGFVQENIKIFLDIENGKKNILYVLHSDFRDGASDNVGGTQLHVKHLKNGMLEDYNVFVAARDGNYLNLTFYSDKIEHFWKFYIGEFDGFFRFADKRLREAWELIFAAFSIDIIHIHQLWSLSFDIMEIAERCNIPIFFTCHDYLLISPSLKLLGEDDEVMRAAGMTADKWEAMLTNRCGIYPVSGYITRWQQRWIEMLKKCEAVFVPGSAAKSLICEYYPELEKNILVVEHGYEFGKKEDSEVSAAENRSGSGKLNLAFVGGINKEKGGEVLCRIIRKLPDSVNVYLFGNIGYPELAALECRNLHKLGKYDSDDIPALFSQYDIDLVGILSVWPETYSYTLSESLLCGVPVIVTAIGALEERMNKLGAGWMVSTDHTADDFITIVGKVLKDRSLLDDKKRTAAQVKIRTLDEMNGEYKEVYSKAAKVVQHAPMTFDAEHLYECCIGKNHIVPGNSLNSVEGRYDEALSEEARVVLDSLSYRMASKMRQVKFPFKQQIWNAMNRKKI